MPFSSMSSFDDDDEDSGEFNIGEKEEEEEDTNDGVNECSKLKQEAFNIDELINDFFELFGYQNLLNDIVPYIYPIIIEDYYIAWKQTINDFRNKIEQINGKLLKYSTNCNSYTENLTKEGILSFIEQVNHYIYEMNCSIKNGDIPKLIPPRHRQEN